MTDPKPDRARYYSLQAQICRLHAQASELAAQAEEVCPHELVTEAERAESAAAYRAHAVTYTKAAEEYVKLQKYAEVSRG
jgi:hypothetical protein